MLFREAIHALQMRHIIYQLSRQYSRVSSARKFSWDSPAARGVTVGLMDVKIGGVGASGAMKCSWRLVAPLGKDPLFEMK